MFFNRKFKQQISDLQDDNADLRKQYNIVLQLLHLRQDDVILLERQLAAIPTTYARVPSYVGDFVRRILDEEAGVLKESVIARISDRLVRRLREELDMMARNPVEQAVDENEESEDDDQ